MSNDEPYYCKICREDFFPFQHLSDEQFIAFEKGINIVSDGALNILPNNRLKSLFKSLNNFNDDKDD